MTTLSEAITGKYGESASDSTAAAPAETPDFVIFVRVQSRTYIPSVLVLDKSDISSIGDEALLKDKCARNVTELDLSYNALTDCKEVIKILKVLPNLKFLNLSFNELSSEYEHNSLEVLPNLTTLILNGTKISWSFVWSILNKCTQLSELHLSKNDFTSVELGPNSSTEFLNMRTLHFAGNPINSWTHVAKLGQVFPSLEQLVLVDCQIQEIPKTAHENFQRLLILSLTNNPLAELEDVSNLSLFPALTDLRIQGTQLFSDLTSHERRNFVVAMLRNVSIVNGGAPIPSSEREDAERAFIRFFDEQQGDKPQRYYELKEIHGDLQPLLNLSLKPPVRVKLHIVLDEVRVEKEVSVYQTTTELKTIIEPLIGIEATRQRLFYVDVESCGMEEMKFPKKQLYSYNMQDGDEIHVRIK